MAANVLNSKRAVEMSVFVVRAFTIMRAALSDTRELARKLASREREVKSRQVGRIDRDPDPASSDERTSPCTHLLIGATPIVLCILNQKTR